MLAAVIQDPDLALVKPLDLVHVLDPIPLVKRLAQLPNPDLDQTPDILDRALVLILPIVTAMRLLQTMNVNLMIDVMNLPIERIVMMTEETMTATDQMDLTK